MEQDPVIIQQQEHLDNEVEDSIDPGIKEYLTQRWKENFEKYISKSVDDREYSTTISPPPSEKLLNAMDKIVEDQAEEIIDRYGNNLWTLNVLYYVTAITVIEKEGKLKEIKKRSGTSVKPGWEVRLESRIEAIRRKLSYTYVLRECYRKQQYTKNQKNIRRKIEKQYGKATTTRLQQVQTQLKQELKVASKKFKKQRII